ncbi:hypothetical protein N3K66_000858 [Trichothecium roseum]|uniref:Uncharacterized protein n=1 Tax=Trichothecium roseum TaxID=47278 RepID=A0ACC0VD46_9HYPO|nr:hypothetical protein N3K66_000858 [Trichothecium roseum]
MTSTKKTLYVALYPNRGARTEQMRYRTSSFRLSAKHIADWIFSSYHWVLLIGPEEEPADDGGNDVPGTRCHVRSHPLRGWFYEEVPLTDVRTSRNLLARLVVAKIKDEERLLGVLRGTPAVNDEAGWLCSSWVVSALARIQEDAGCVAEGSKLDWEEIEAQGRDYVGRKMDKGRYAEMEDSELPRPTWDMLEDKEVLA